MKYVYLPLATKLGRGYVFTRVCDSVHGGGGSAPLHSGIQAPPGPEADNPPPAQCMLGHTGNKRTVRSLMECNLVMYENELHNTYYAADHIIIYFFKFSYLNMENKRFCLVAYLHCRIRTPILIPIQTTNQMATLYYRELFTLHRVRFRFQS